MPRHWRYIRVGPFGFGFPELWWEEPRWLDVESTLDEVIITLRLPREIKKEEIKVQYREGKLRIIYPRKKERDWESLPIE